jgi:predicted RNA-binding protein YlxR (DUF448 family)
MRPRRVPIRTCVACRTTDAKRALLRVVRQPDGTVCYDAKGKMSGRGAYVCARAECIEQARKQKKLERSLKVEKIAPELFQELLQIVSQNDATAPAEPPPAQQMEIGEQNDRG